MFAVFGPGQPAPTPEAVEMERERTCQNMEGQFNSLISIHFTMCHLTSKWTMDVVVVLEFYVSPTAKVIRRLEPWMLSNKSNK